MKIQRILHLLTLKQSSFPHEVGISISIFSKSESHRGRRPHHQVWKSVLWSWYNQSSSEHFTTVIEGIASGLYWTRHKATNAILSAFSLSFFSIPLTIIKSWNSPFSSFFQTHLNPLGKPLLAFWQVRILLLPNISNNSIPKLRTSHLWVTGNDIHVSGAA